MRILWEKIVVIIEKIKGWYIKFLIKCKEGIKILENNCNKWNIDWES